MTTFSSLATMEAVIKTTSVASSDVGWKIFIISPLTHWGRVTHMCVGNLTIIGADNGLSPGRRQAIIWTNTEILLIGPLGTNFSEILITIEAFSFKKMHLKTLSAKWREFCLGLKVLMQRTAEWCHRVGHRSAIVKCRQAPILS